MFKGINDPIEIRVPMKLSLCPSPRGRPVDFRKDEQILKAAGQLFMREGLQGTTMEQIAKEANVSKLTLYRRYPDKNALFMEIILSKCEHYLPDDILQVPDNLSGREALERLGIALMQLITSEAGLDLNRLIITETTHNPQLGRAFYARGPEPFHNAVNAIMERLRERAELKTDDTALAADFYVALLIGNRMCEGRRLNLIAIPTEIQIEHYVKSAVAFFLKAFN